MGQNKAAIWRALRKMTDLILPPVPLIPNWEAAIGDDWAKITFLDEPCCVCCGFPFEYAPLSSLGGEANITECAGCAARAPAYDHARAAFQYDDVSRDFILSFKHGGRTEHIDMFARQMCRAGQVLLTEADILMPVPLHPKRLIKRRYNQSTLLARSMAQQAGLEVDCDTLYRRRATASQGGKTATGRRRNVQGAFALREGTDLDGKHIVIIDDVMTTGATLEACAQTLKKGGARRVDALTLARVVKGAAIPT